MAEAKPTALPIEAFGDDARKPFDPRDYVVDGVIKKDDVMGCISQCTYRYCLSKDYCSN